MRELYRCSMMPGMPAEPIRDPRLSAQNVVPACGSCQGGGDMIFQDKEALMRQIMEAGFAMDDVVLFLDTHPDCAQAMQYYQSAVGARKAAMDAYQSRFGPLLVDDVIGNTWTWVTEKWPWEGGC